MRVTSTMGMRSVCSPRSTKTAAGRFQTQPPLGQRMVSACDWGVTVTSPTVTLSPEVVCHLNISLGRFIKPPLLKFISDTLLTDALVWRLSQSMFSDKGKVLWPNPARNQYGGQNDKGVYHAGHCSLCPGNGCVKRSMP